MSGAWPLALEECNLALEVHSHDDDIFNIDTNLIQRALYSGLKLRLVEQST